VKYNIYKTSTSYLMGCHINNN